MRSILRTSLLLIVLCFSFVSCSSNDDSGTAPSIEGFTLNTSSSNPTATAVSPTKMKTNTTYQLWLQVYDPDKDLSYAKIGLSDGTQTEWTTMHFADLDGSKNSSEIQFARFTFSFTQEIKNGTAYIIIVDDEGNESNQLNLSFSVSN